MKIIGWIACILFVLLLHAGFVAFGGYFFHSLLKKEQVKPQEVQWVDLDAPKVDKPPDPAPEEQKEEIKEVQDQPPDASSIKLDAPAPNSEPALSPSSLNDLEALLNGATGGSDGFGGATSLQSGVLGGSGGARDTAEKLDAVFTLAEIDQKPRAVYQAAPIYPTEMRGKKVQGEVTVIFVVDADGRVASPRIEKSNNAAFENPAMIAVKKWKFEPGIKGGERVACKMRVPIRFPSS